MFDFKQDREQIKRYGNSRIKEKKLKALFQNLYKIKCQLSEIQTLKKETKSFSLQIISLFKFFSLLFLKESLVIELNFEIIF